MTLARPGVAPHDASMSDGTFSNWTGSPPPDITLEKLAETARAIDALPKVPRDITAAPDVIAALRRGGHLPDPASPVLLGITIWEDATLSPGTWHRGKPLREQIRDEQMQAIRVFCSRR